MSRILLLGSSIIRRFYYQELGWIVDNLGIDGLLTTDLFTENYTNIVFTPPLPAYHSMIFYCGNNDLKHGIPVEKVVDNIHQFLQLFRKFYPTTKIFVISLLYSPMNHILGLFPQIDYINQQLFDQQEEYRFIDLGHNITDTIYYQPDLVHLNQLGYDQLHDFVKTRCV